MDEHAARSVAERLVAFMEDGMPRAFATGIPVSPITATRRYSAVIHPFKGGFYKDLVKDTPANLVGFQRHHMPSRGGGGQGESGRKHLDL
jgi:hypothetical protein